MILSFFQHPLLVVGIFGKELVVTPFDLILYLVLIIILLYFLAFLLKTYIYCLRFKEVDHYPGPFERTQWHRKAFRRWTRLDIDENESISDDDISIDNDTGLCMDNVTNGLEMTDTIPTNRLLKATISTSGHEKPDTPFSPSILFKGNFKETIV